MVLDYEVRDHVAFLTLNRPDQMNAQNLEMRCALVEAFQRVDLDPDVWVVVITGRGRAFSAGHDLKETLTPEQEASDPGTANVYRSLQAIRKPTLAAINGFCLAQGAGLALLTDIRVASKEAEFGWPQVKRGISSVSGPTLLARTLPHNIAFEFLFTGRYCSAEDALSLNLVNRVVPKDKVMDETMSIVGEILENAPLSLRSIKEIYLRTKGLSQAEAFYHAGVMTKEVRKSQDAKEGLAAFADKRKPVWKGY